MAWVLMLFIHAGALSHNDDVAVASVRFYNESACEAAGKATSDGARSTVQSVQYACIHDPVKAN